ncbi:energy-coupling factor transporter transmembrane protein EcfT [Sporolactobacillus shoreicorticis]|uniref:Energy-coupling factor transporter transmembrane protein EcfT n=1 Tax=Sporolactobacillus shoreicorticis TaxID=1923877 RepID=A0ABW5SAC2_9BACL|nr:energy-coupling factor transporter transmembrane protein EcfT [Sporolactobacillus shoreicorticis]MCO7128208.1 energy-coupling factor transporter transmembrane protein EcfT [Sporolactobacillus shoreicorticis]
MHLKKWGSIVHTVLLVTVGSLLFFILIGTFARAAGLVDETVSAQHTYSHYPLDNYQLDFYVDNSWDWLPWNWTDGIGKQVMYGLYAITNFIWTLSLYLSNATGYLVQEAYSLDFVSQTSSAIGKNMQTLAGISPSGFRSSGFYPGFLLLFLLILGIYVAYVGVIKRETTKAMHAVMNFLVVFLLSTSFIAYAPDYIDKINDFSADVSKASLSLGTKMVMPHSESQGQDSTPLIRDNLFSIQVQQPWLLLQYGNSDMKKIGPKRVEKLLSKSPDAHNGQDRETAVKEEIENKNNKNLTLTKTTPRLGMVFFLFLFNIGISIFVFLLSGIMIFSQILFIIYALFLPISFLLSMIPGFNGMGKQALMKLFNVIMTRAGITLIVTIAFSISTMLYALSGTFPFFLIAFLQIVTFAGIYAKLGDLMGQFHLQASESQQMGRRILQRPYRFFHRETQRWKRKMGHFFTGRATGTAAGPESRAKASRSGASQRTQTRSERPTQESTSASFKKKPHLEAHIDRSVGAGKTTKKRSTNNSNESNKQTAVSLTNTRQVLIQEKNEKRDPMTKKAENTQTRTVQRVTIKKQNPKESPMQQRLTLAQRRLELDRARQQKATHSSLVERSGIEPTKDKPTKKQKAVTSHLASAQSVMPDSTPKTNRRTINPVRSAKDQAKKSQAKNPALNPWVGRMPDSTVRQALTKQELNRIRSVATRNEHAPTPPNATRQPVTPQKSRQRPPLAKKQGAALKHNGTETGQQIRQRMVRRQRGRRK